MNAGGLSPVAVGRLKAAGAVVLGKINVPLRSPELPRADLAVIGPWRGALDKKEIPYAAQSMWWSVATLTGLPATAMPIGLRDDGLPIGTQIVGPYLEDRTTIAFAELTEREFGGFVAPPALQP